MKNNLAKIRQESQVSQAELSNLSGISQPALSAYENGRRALRPERARKLILAFKKCGVDLTFNDFYEINT